MLNRAICATPRRKQYTPTVIEREGGAFRGRKTPAPVPILVLFAVPFESEPFIRMRIAQRISVAYVGMGMTCAGGVLNRLLEWFQPRVVVSAGLAGSLVSAISVPQVLSVNAVIRMNEGSFELPHNAVRAGARMVSVEAVAATAAEKRRLGIESGAELVDMETWELARICRERRISFRAVRAVSDGVDEDIPAAILGSYCMATQRSSVRGFIGGILRMPREIPAVVRFLRNASRARLALAMALVAEFEQEPGSPDPDQQGSQGVMD